MNTSRLQAEQYRKGILAGDRVVLAKAITLMESTLPGDQQLAGEVLDTIIGDTGNSLRIGITGAPGVGKSTFIESFGKSLILSGNRVAVLTIDPSSQVTGGSILGDKTRMQELARDPHAFIRPTASGHTLGGVASHTRETILLCEAAGFEIVIVETVGTGQSEVAVKNMVDFFLLLIQPGSGDELQGIKKGIVEMADAIVVTKADGPNINVARATQADFQHAVHISGTQRPGWTLKVLTCSSTDKNGLNEIMDTINLFREKLAESGYLAHNRKEQNLSWFKDYFLSLLSLDPARFIHVTAKEHALRSMISSSEISARNAAEQLLEAYHQAIRDSSPRP